MKTYFKIVPIAAIAVFGMAVPAFAGNCSGAKVQKASYTTEAETPNLVQTAASVDDLSTLVAAVQAADLVDALQAEGPFTVFAPTNGAFGGLPTGTVDTLLRPENKAALTRVLTSHVIAGEFDAAKITKKAQKNGGTVTVETLSGAKLTAVLANGSLFVKDEQGGLAEVAMADVGTSNGVVHVVNRVLLPANTHTS
jgi:uncharacterized surface protein with fasciclin (FAS1) repeats